jgi:hypothetical protein
MLNSTKTLLFLALLSFLACSKKYTAETIPAERLQFGTGGGFTGQQTIYVLLSNGQIFKQKGLDGKKFESIGKVKKAAAKQLYERCSAYQKVKLDRPADMNHFVGMHNDSTKFNWQWGANLNTKDSTVNSMFQLHKDLLNLIPTLETSNK